MTTREPSQPPELQELMWARVIRITARKALAGSEAAAELMERFRPNVHSEREAEIFADYDAQRRRQFH